MRRTFAWVFGLSFILTIAGPSAAETEFSKAEVSEADRRRLDAARASHAQEIERAVAAYRNAILRANTNVDRAYQNVIRNYERRGEESAVAALQAELEQIQSNQEVPAVVPPGHLKMIESIGPGLIRADGTNLPTGSLVDKQYVLLYFSAGWCGPCRAFTPSLVEFYEKNRAGGRFEVVFVSSDNSFADMQKYMRDYRMAFPAVPYARVGPSGLRNTYGGRGIPNLVIVDREGEVVSGSYVGERYVGPRKVLQDMEKILAEAN